ncbi:MAG: hypothetical protein RR835_08270 [Peptostreptococcaceae bacterium]
MTKKIIDIYSSLRGKVLKKAKCDSKFNYTLNNKETTVNKIMNSYSYFEEENIDKNYIDNCNYEIEDIHKKILEEINWINSIDNIKEVDDLIKNSNSPKYLKKNSLYYKSNYICPNCNEHALYKIRAYNIDTVFNGKYKKLHHIFTCPNCRIFLGSIRIYNKLHTKWIGNKLSNYALISDKYSKLKYNKIINYTESIYSDDI